MRTATEIQRRFWRAHDRMIAARVPEGDRDRGAPIEPVTVGGYYPAATLSGRPAWLRVEWIHGHPRELHCTYDLDAERVAEGLVLAGADPLWPAP